MYWHVGISPLCMVRLSRFSGIHKHLGYWRELLVSTGIVCILGVYGTGIVCILGVYGHSIIEPLCADIREIWMYLLTFENSTFEKNSEMSYTRRHWYPDSMVPSHLRIIILRMVPRHLRFLVTCLICFFLFWIFFFPFFFNCGYLAWCFAVLSHACPAPCCIESLPPAQSICLSLVRFQPS